MFCVSTFSPGVMLYIFPKGRLITLWSGGSIQVSKDAFIAVYNLFNFAGESISRKLAYTDKQRRNPFLFLVFSALGVSINVLATKVYWMPVVCPIAGFFIFFANGSIYNHTCRKIDETVQKRFNLTALSFWLFLGDFGSVAGSNCMAVLKVWMVGSG
jgi:hypothetical protein